MGGNYTITTRSTGTVLTAAIYNADHQNHVDNQTPQGTDDYSANVAQMQTATDPGESGTESLATSTAGELERLRFALQEIKSYLSINAGSNWYQTPTGLIPASKLSASMATASITFIIDGGGAVPTTGVKGDLLIPFACTITQATMQADQSGSAVIDIWKKTYTLDSPPTVANTITASALPTLSSHQSSQDSTLTGWTTSIAAGDMLRFNLNSVSTCQRITLTLKVTKT